MSLPKSIEDYFSRSQAVLQDLYKPDWLLNDPLELTWLIRVGKHSRQVNGRWRGLTKLRWDFRLPGGRFGVGKYSKICREFMRLYMQIIEGNLQAGLTLKSAYLFHRNCLRFIEHVLLIDPAVCNTGIQGIAIDHIHSFLGTYKRSGVAGTAKLVDRFEAFIHRELGSGGQRAIQLWFDTQDATYKARVDCVDRTLLSREPSETPKMVTTLDMPTLRAARRMFAWKGWFDEVGSLRVEALSEALETDPIRLAHGTFPYYLRQFELVTDYQRQEFSRDSYRSELDPSTTLGARFHSGTEYLTTSFCDSICSLSIAAAQDDSFLTCDLANIVDVRAAVAPHRNYSRARTRTIPASLGIEIISHCISWYLDYATPIAAYVEDVVTKTSCLLRTIPQIKKLDAIELAVAETPVPQELQALRVSGFRRFKRSCDGSPSPNTAQSGLPDGRSLSFVELIRLNVAVCLILTAALGAPRRKELFELSFRKVHVRKGRAFIEVELRKTGFSEVRIPFKKPVPRLVVDFLRQVNSIKRSLLKIYPTKDPLVHDAALFSFGPLGIRILSESVDETMLDLFSEHFRLKNKDGRAWYVRLHQLRRSFALSFFHCGGRENSLPALSWFLGHDDIATTWRYIREELTGAEISAAEAAMATSAIYSDDAMETTERLRSIVLEHFGVSKMALIDEERVQDYLELLQEKGFYHVDPVEIRTSSGVRYSVMIVVRKV